MKEIKSESKWVGKILTCEKCNRTFEVEAGDEILPGFTRGGSKGYIKKTARFMLGCGHEHSIQRTLNLG